MKEVFKDFFAIPPERLSYIWGAESTVFVFDTNCYLNMYRCEKKTREDFLKAFGKVKDKVYIPFMVGLEFNRNRSNVISATQATLSKIGEGIKNKVDHFNERLSRGNSDLLYPTLTQKLNELKHSFHDSIDEFYRVNVVPMLEDVKFDDNDPVMDALCSIPENKVGRPWSQERVNTINTVGKLRFEKQIPPGYKDENKPKDKSYRFNGVEFIPMFGDLYIWTEIKEFCKEINECSVIFVTDDQKEDWAQKENNGSTVPRMELVQEIRREAKVDNFIMYSQAEFLREISERFKDLNINDDSIVNLKYLDGIERGNGWASKFIMLQNTLTTALALSDETAYLLSNSKEALGEERFDFMFEEYERYNKVVKSIASSLNYADPKSYHPYDSQSTWKHFFYEKMRIQEIVDYSLDSRAASGEPVNTNESRLTYAISQLGKETLNSIDAYMNLLDEVRNPSMLFRE